MPRPEDFCVCMDKKVGAGHCGCMKPGATGLDKVVELLAELLKVVNEMREAGEAGEACEAGEG